MRKRIILITGASSGIGREYALLLQDKCKKADEFWLVARRKERMVKLAEKINKPCRIFEMDLCGEKNYSKLILTLKRENPMIMMLVNSAGYGKIGRFDRLDLDGQTGMIRLNCEAIVRMTRLCLPYMRKGSRIINVSSAAAFCPQPDFSVYAASKAFVTSFSHGIARELKTRGIHVHLTSPGPVNTGFFQHTGQEMNAAKNIFMVEAKQVVVKSVSDFERGLTESVYPLSMRIGQILAKLVPFRLATFIMHKVNGNE